MHVLMCPYNVAHANKIGVIIASYMTLQVVKGEIAFSRSHLEPAILQALCTLG